MSRHYNPNSDTVTNSICTLCNTRFNATLENLVVCGECGLVYHQKCYLTNSILMKKDKCHNSLPIPESEIKKYSIQKHIDMHSLKKTNYVPSITDYCRAIFFRAPYLLFHFTLLYVDYTYGYFFGKYSKNRYKTFIKAVNYGLNIKSKIIGQEKINPNNNVVLVLNHVSFHDALIIPKYINTSAIASVSVLRHILVQILSKYTNVLFVKRGESSKDKNIVDQINDFIDMNGNIGICSQGLLGKYDTLSKFRTSAFRTKHPVQPIMLKYKQDVSSIDTLNILLFPRVDVEIFVMDITKIDINETPNQFTERVRMSMAKQCNFTLSNVYSNDVKD